MISIGFVILCWNSQKVIEACLSSIAAMSSIDCRIIVVDNGSEDKTTVIVKRFMEKNNAIRCHCDLIQLEKNYGTTVSRNKGLRKLVESHPDTQFICILDSDTEVNEAAFERLVAAIKDTPQYGIIGPRLHDRNGAYQISGRAIPTLQEKLCKVLPIKTIQRRGEKLEQITPEQGRGCVAVGYLMSACWLMRAEVFKQLGWLDEKIFYAPEDVEYCIRCWKKGFQVMYCYDADILHHWQRISRKKLFSKHNFEHLKGLAHLFWKYRFLLNGNKLIPIKELKEDIV